MQVEKVEYTQSAELRNRYDAKKKEFQAAGKSTEEKLVFHGTTEESIGKIIKEGFKIGGEGGVAIRFGAAYGKGVYTASNPEISVPYSNGMMLLSVALCGKEGEDYKVGGSSDVFVICHSHQLLPRYIVHYRNTSP